MRHRHTPTSLTNRDAPREVERHHVETAKHGERVPRFLQVLIYPEYLWGDAQSELDPPFGVNMQIEDMKWTVLLRRSRVDIEKHFG